MSRVFWADRGQMQLLDLPETGTVCCGASRLGSLQLAGQAFSIWLQLRGSAWVEAREGRFRLQAGDWIAFERDSRPSVQVDRDGVCIALALDAEAQRTLSQYSEAVLYAGRGSMPRRDRRIALKLWRLAAERLGADGGTDPGALRPLLLHLGALQRELHARIPRCPGRSRQRKRQVFGRLQRARLYLEGNSDRVVRIGELAQLTSFSSWYFSKTFHSLYEESPQAASVRIRLERAAELLRSSAMTIGEVAAACGFDNCCSFARAFKGRHGMSATQYRRAHAARPKSAHPSEAARKALPQART
ncbi:MAG TPA: AraC family transcriptional regulator [Lysobacter sp.]|nr:AraC family transcriptional regulator [Lysobacter sp.]